MGDMKDCRQYEAGENCPSPDSRLKKCTQCHHTGRKAVRNNKLPYPGQIYPLGKTATDPQCSQGSTKMLEFLLKYSSLKSNVL
jgi:hypothetical protein